MLYNMKTVFAVLMVLVLTGCSTKDHIGKISLPKETPKVWRTVGSSSTLAISQTLLEWIDDAHLNRLVREAVDNNPDLHATALRLKAAKVLNRAERSKQLPSVGIRASGARSSDNIDLYTGKNVTQTSHKLSLGVSWELDIWGRIADERAASYHQLQIQELEFQYAKDTLAVRTIQTWIELAGIERSIAIEKERLQTFKQIKELLLERYRHGIGGLEELSSAKSREAVAKSELYEQSNLKQRTIRKLELLLGRYPKSTIATPKRLPRITTVATTVPLNVLSRRPDIRMAIEKVATSRYRADATSKARLPQLNISADLFRSTTTLGALGGEQNYWSLLGGIFAPLYEGGRLRDEASAAKYETDATLMELHTKVLEALKECEDYLGNEQTLSFQITSITNALNEATQSSRYYTRRYRNGLGTLQSLLIAKEEEMALKRQLNDIKTARLSNRVDLSLAMGTGLNLPTQIKSDTK
jgi:NodT family efflux transporter outer membrane factor (OMF) lipoprotein